MKTILFQGDSITDCGRSREDNANVGIGYPVLVKAGLGYEHPDKWNIFSSEVRKRAENTYWLGDGVHPTAMGHELIKREWLKVFGCL